MSKNTPMGPLFASGLILLVLVGCFVSAHSGGGGNEIADNSMTTPAPTDQVAATDPVPLEPAQSDTVKFDPKGEEKRQIVAITSADTHQCVGAYVALLLHQGDRSRSHIASLVTDRCSIEWVRDGVMSEPDARSEVNSEALLAVDNEVAENDPDHSIMAKDPPN